MKNALGMLGFMAICLGYLDMIQNTIAIKYIDIQPHNIYENVDNSTEITSVIEQDGRRHWLDTNLRLRSPSNKEEKDEGIKSKISTLVDQTLYDTERKVLSVKHLKEQHRDEAPYKAGFIISMIKKSKEVLNELFNVAIKHKDDWKALEQLKVFELIVHTNVDTTNLVRQLVEIHVQNLNSTDNHNTKRRVVLIRK